MYPIFYLLPDDCRFYVLQKLQLGELSGLCSPPAALAEGGVEEFLGRKVIPLGCKYTKNTHFGAYSISYNHWIPRDRCLEVESRFYGLECGACVFLLAATMDRFVLCDVPR